VRGLIHVLVFLCFHICDGFGFWGKVGGRGKKMEMVISLIDRYTPPTTWEIRNGNRGICDMGNEEGEEGNGIGIGNFLLLVLIPFGGMGGGSIEYGWIGTGRG